MKIKKFLSELLGTFLLVFLGTTAYALLGSTGLGSTYSTVAGIIGIAVVFGLAMTFVYYMFSSISGAHVNPAVSIAMYFNGAISLVEVHFLQVDYYLVFLNVFLVYLLQL